MSAWHLNGVDRSARVARLCRLSIWQRWFSLWRSWPWRADAEPAPLVLEKTIPLPDVGGRIDHMAIDPKTTAADRRRLGKRYGRNHRSRRRQAASQRSWARGAAGCRVCGSDGRDFRRECRRWLSADLSRGGFFGTRPDLTFTVTRTTSASIHATAMSLSGMAMAASRSSIRRAARSSAPSPLHGHPEGFQIDPATGQAFVNVPDAGQIAVVDLDARRQTATWKVPGASGNYPNGTRCRARNAGGGISKPIQPGVARHEDRHRDGQAPGVRRCG